MASAAKNQQTVEAALAFDCDPISEAIGEGCGECAGCEGYAALRDLVAQADPPLEAIRRLIDAYYGDQPESMEVAIAAQKIESWVARLDGAR